MLGTRDPPRGKRRDDDADWSVKTYRGKRADGTPWEKVVTWFGFELHLLADSAHDMPLDYKVTKASASDPSLWVVKANWACTRSSFEGLGLAEARKS